VHASLLSAVVAALPAVANTSKKSGGSPIFLLYIFVIFFIVYLLFIRPARNRQRAAVDARRQAVVGDEIITTSGLLATVVEVADDALTLEIAPGVRARFVPAAILRVVSPEPEDDVETDATNHEVIEAPDEPTDSPDGSTST
jgi:preprotein translocase subunit YajC